MKLNAIRVLIFLGIIALSIAFGLGFNAVATAVEKNSYPKDKGTAPLVEKYAALHGLPEPVLWAVISAESDFASNALSPDGKIGLMQLSPETFERISKELLEKEMESGMLYDPDTNVSAGSAYLSYLYRRYGVWDTAFAAYHAGPAQVDAWLADEKYVTPQGTLQNLPDAATAQYIKEVNKRVDLYRKLYYQ